MNETSYAHPDSQRFHREPLVQAAPARDPVCGMTVDPTDAKHHVSHAGVDYYFCSATCQAKFDAEPTKYLGSSKPVAAADPPTTGTIYTCPMHPQIRQPKPGHCPICGMALEPLVPTLQICKAILQVAG